MVLITCVIGATFISCAPRSERVQLRFILTNSDSVQRLQFYVHDVVLIGGDGQGHVAQLVQRQPSQSDRIALIDLTPGASPEAQGFVEVTAPRLTYTGLRFVVGVPFDMNHGNPLMSPAPLNRGELFWSWQAGYKFLRLDVSKANHESAFHLGSTGCSSASALRPPAAPCLQPNLIHVELRDFDPLTQPISVRVGEIVEALNEEGLPHACTGDYSHPACARAFENTGLDPRSGVCSGGAAPVCSQRLFHVAEATSDER